MSAEQGNASNVLKGIALACAISLVLWLAIAYLSKDHLAFLM
jgi:hypothetical protein